jgi:hypothetical protein
MEEALAHVRAARGGVLVYERTCNSFQPIMALGPSSQVPNSVSGITYHLLSVAALLDEHRGLRKKPRHRPIGRNASNLREEQWFLPSLSNIAFRH